MKRTAEIVLGIIGTFFNVIGIAFIGVMIRGVSEVKNNEQFQDEILKEFKSQQSNDPQLQDIDIQTFTDGMGTIINFLGVFGWLIIASFIISLIVGVVATVKVVKVKDKKANFAGSMFLIAGVLAGILSLTSIIYYIAAIICFVRKPKEVFDDISNQNASAL
ncbi:DUF4064 domain-containing protein [Rummeliibacillus suwonensis]|uniref:DUF4064 domain-containing protein n=1 Tax=Rummeliibacillus suwonensis TaxID=1306154 RepID=UPI0016462FB4|nr:DUF4064 domain-containing protein [Rummeliibacillus suwonensis]